MITLPTTQWLSVVMLKGYVAQHSRTGFDAAFEAATKPRGDPASTSQNQGKVKQKRAGNFQYSH